MKRINTYSHFIINCFKLAEQNNKVGCMCGIVGIFGKSSKKEKLHQLAKMNQAIVHRGPDDFGEWANEGAGFGMRRLSIIDLEGGHQPIWFENIGIVFNGEIYNFQKLKQELIDLGEEFDTSSDTEVVLKAYHQWGVKFLDKLVGMFAICLIDLVKNRALLARDHTGIKPLYIGRFDQKIYFSSEIKSIKAVVDVNDVNFESINDYLTFRFIPGDKTAWQGITKLPAGHYLTVDLLTGNTEEHTFWQLNFNSQKISAGRDYVKEFDQLFSESVNGQIIADVPVGAFLSGGLDSTAICAKAVQLGHKNFHTFSVAFEQDEKFSELSFARLVAEHLGTEHHEVLVSQEQFLSFIKNQPYFTDDPLADLTTVPVYFLAAEARKHIKVALSGEGADEILGGYTLSEEACRADKRKFTQYIPRQVFSILKHLPTPFSEQISSMAGLGWGGYVAVRPDYISIDMLSEQKKRLWKDKQFTEDSLNKIKEEYRLVCSPHPMDKLQQVLSSSWLKDDLLAKADKMSMAASLEVRVPFLDHHLVNWAMSLPIEWKVGDKRYGFVTKRVLREALKSFVPKIILERKKQGFPIPVYQWLSQDLGVKLGKELLEDYFLTDWFNKDELEKIIKKAQAGELASQKQFWSLYTLGLWKQKWLN